VDYSNRKLATSIYLIILKSNNIVVTNARHLDITKSFMIGTPHKACLLLRSSSWYRWEGHVARFGKREIRT